MWVINELGRDEILLYQGVKYCCVGAMCWLWQLESTVTGEEAFSARVVQ